MEKVSARAENRSPVSETGLRFSARPNGLRNPLKVHVIEMKFQPGLKKEREHVHQSCFRISVNLAEIHHVIATKFLPGGRREISARAETRHVIRLLRCTFDYLQLLSIINFSRNVKGNAEQHSFCFVYHTKLNECNVFRY